HIFYVMDMSNGGAVARQHAEGFAKLLSGRKGSIILTKTDNGSSKGGGVLSAIRSCHCTVSFTGNGEHMDDLQVFDPDSFVSQLLGKPDLKFWSRLKEREKKTTGTLSQNSSKFTLRHLMEQYKQLAESGSMESMAEMFQSGSGPRGTTL